MIPKPSFRHLLTAAMLLLAAGTALVLWRNEADARQAPHSTLVWPGPDGRLQYSADERGNLIPDFSYAGYFADGRQPPAVPAVMELQPGSGDDTRRIQRSLDALAQRKPGSDGFRGCLQLGPGEFRIDGTLRISASGIVVRGSGQGPGGTILRAAGKGQRSLILARPDGKLPAYPEIARTRSAVAQDFVPLGARSLRVQDASLYQVGQLVVVQRPSTDKWISELGMDRIPESRTEKITQWTAGSRDLRYLRRVSAINGNTISFNVPLFHDLDRDWADSFVYRYDESVLIDNIGVEDLQLVSDYASETDEDHGWTGVEFDYCRNIWVRNVTSRHFGFALVSFGHESYHGSVFNCSSLSPKSQVVGGRRYSFNCGGQNHLVKGCLAEGGRHDFAVATNRSAGTVFTGCQSRGTHSSSEPHHRYSTGTLYDNITFEKPDTQLVLGLWNRSNYGTGHGWSAAYCVLWNCRAPGAGIACEKPPLAQNYAIGCESKWMSGNMRWGEDPGLKKRLKPNGAHWEHWNNGPVEPLSLYEAQLADRLGR
ncbi:hypothetical protein KDL29_11970 [bacterium]|nr:hypothetical protein [bacterium]